MELTPEQNAIVDAPMVPGRAVFVQAFAGTGKTSTIAVRCRGSMNTRILYLAFNRALMDAARDLFRDYPHVRVETFHSWALSEYRKEGEENEDGGDGSPIVESVSVYDVLDAFPSVPWDVASGALAVLQHFFATTDAAVAARHTKAVPRGVSKTESLALAQSIWHRMGARAFPVPHDAYLKRVWSHRCRMDYDWIVVDEVQDLTELQLDLVIAQTHAAWLLFGDVHQTLYGFRYACDPVAFLERHQVPYASYHLTRTFRFGPKLAHLSTMFLRRFKDESVMIESAHDPEATRVLAPIEWSLAPRGSVLVFRSNRGLVDALFSYVDHPHPPKLHVLGSTFVPERERGLLRDLARVRLGRCRECHDPILKRLKSWDMAARFFQVVRDYKFMHRLDLIQTYGSRELDRFWTELDARLVDTPGEADVVLGTVHQTKGLEFDHVIMGPDFPAPKDPTKLRHWQKDGAKELTNILYVAMTRAVRTIYLNEDLHRFCQLADRTLADPIGSA